MMLNSGRTLQILSLDGSVKSATAAGNIPPAPPIEANIGLASVDGSRNPLTPAGNGAWACW